MLQTLKASFDHKGQIHFVEPVHPKDCDVLVTILAGVESPNAKTAKTLKDARAGIGLESTSLAKLDKDWDDVCGK